MARGFVTTRQAPLLGAMCAGIAAMACSGTLPEPRMGDGEHEGIQPVVVSTMPPPGKVEIVSSRPRELKQPVWVDGEWEWTGRRWVWKEHGWEETPKGKVYEPPVTKRQPDGSLVHYPGAWKAAPGAAP